MHIVYDADDGQYWVRLPSGQQVPVPDDAAADLDTLRGLFRARFGREPLPGDPLIFDPAQDMPTALGREAVQEATAHLLSQWNAHPAFQAAHAQLGFVLTTVNLPFADAGDVVRWADTVADWCRAHPGAEAPPSVILEVPRNDPTDPGACAAAREAGEVAVRLAADDRYLVVAFLALQAGTRELAVIYDAAFVQCCRDTSPAFTRAFAAEKTTEHGWGPYLAAGWIPVGVVAATASPTATCVPVPIGVLLTGAELDTAFAVAMARIDRVIGGMAG